MVASVAPDLTDPHYRAAIVDLLGAVGYGEISACERLTEDAGRAPSLADKLELLQLANAQFAKVNPILDGLRDLGVDPYDAMAPFQEPIDTFHEYTAPADWWESLVKAYVGDNLVRDFYPRATPILISNMECNDWKQIIWTRWGNWPQPFDPATAEVLR